jgi:biopolymer transport protein ExbB
MCGKRSLQLAVLTAATLLAAPAFAQDSAGSFFEAFMWSDDIIGLAVIWFLVVASVFVVGYIGRLALKYRRSTLIPEATRVAIEEALAAKRYREAIDMANEDSSYLGKLVSGALNEASNGFSAMERSVEEIGDRETTRMLRPLEYLNVMGNIAPMLGLFGTVYGMIRAFFALVEAGGQAEPTKLAAGISTALVTTFWGLIVAMPALAGYALIRNKVDELSSEGLLVAEDLIRPFKPASKKAAGGSTPPSGGGPSGGSSAGGSSRPPATPKPQ